MSDVSDVSDAGTVRPRAYPPKRVITLPSYVVDSYVHKKIIQVLPSSPDKDRRPTATAPSQKVKSPQQTKPSSPPSVSAVSSVTALSTADATSATGSSGETISIDLRRPNNQARIDDDISNEDDHASFTTAKEFLAGASQAEPVDGIFERTYIASILSKVPPFSVQELVERGNCARDTTRDDFLRIFSQLKTRLCIESCKTMRTSFDSTLASFIGRLNDLWKKQQAKRPSFYGIGSTCNTFKYGSSWNQDKLCPLETNILLIYTLPPTEWADWWDPSPTMNRMRKAGIDDIRVYNTCSWIHLHNHSHPTGTRSDARQAHRTEGSGQAEIKYLYRKWPSDPPELCAELELQATYVICERMKQARPYLMVCFGEYGRDWFETYHDNGRFRKALGYEYQLESMTWLVSERPPRFVEAKILRPKDTSIETTIIALFPNSAAFVAHDLKEPDTDVIGKALRLDASMEILRSCFAVSATMPTKTVFTRKVLKELTKQGLPAPYTWNLMHECR